MILNTGKMKRGIVQIPVLIGLLIMAVAVPVATKLVQENQNLENRAASCTEGNLGTLCQNSQGVTCQLYRYTNCSTACIANCNIGLNPITSAPTRRPDPEPTDRPAATAVPATRSPTQATCKPLGTQVTSGGQCCSGKAEYRDSSLTCVAAGTATPIPTRPPCPGACKIGTSCPTGSSIIPGYTSCGSSGVCCTVVTTPVKPITRYECNPATGSCGPSENGYLVQSECQANCVRAPRPTASATTCPGACKIGTSCPTGSSIIPGYTSCGSSGVCCTVVTTPVKPITRYECNPATGSCGPSENGYLVQSECQANCVRAPRPTASATTCPGACKIGTSCPTGSSIIPGYTSCGSSGVCCTVVTTPARVASATPTGGGPNPPVGGPNPPVTVPTSGSGDPNPPSSGTTCSQSCSGTTLRDCTVKDSDGTSRDSTCNTVGRIESCGGASYCCPSVGGNWTTDMSKCNTKCTQCANNPGAKLKGDADCTGDTSINDYQIWIDEFRAGQMGQLNKNSWRADFDCTGMVDINDYQIWIDNFKKVN